MNIKSQQYHRVFLVLVITALIITLSTSTAIAQETVIVDNRNTADSDTNSIQEAIDMVEDGGEIIIREHSQLEPYEGGIIGTESEGMSDGKSVNIRGEGIAMIKAPSNQDAALDIYSNENRHVNIENIMFTDSEYAIQARSNSEITVEDIAMSSSISSSPFFLNNNIAGSDDTGAYIEDKGTYFPSTMSSIEEHTVESQSGDILFDSITSNPSSLIYDRVESNLDYNPVTQSSLSGTIQVGDSAVPDALTEEDDYDLSTPFKSLQSAIDAAEPGALIEVYPKLDNEPYDSITFSGNGITGVDDLTIVGKETLDNSLPQVKEIRGNYPGDYSIHNMQINEGVVSTVDNADIDVSRNYWLSSSGPSASDYRITTGTSSAIITEPFCVDDSCLSSYEFTDLDMCMTVETYDDIGLVDEESYGCSENQDEVTVTIDTLEQSSRLDLFGLDLTDYREADVEVSSPSNRDVDVEINVIQSDASYDSEIEVDALDSFEEGQIEAQFSTLIDSMEREQMTLSPRAIVQINNNPQMVVDLSDTTLYRAEEGDDLVRLPSNIGQYSGSIGTDDFTGIIQNQTTAVSRFNADTDETQPMQDNIIPPSRYIGGENINEPSGTVEYFYEARSGSDRAAIIRPDEGLRTGFSTTGVPEANQHYLSITYALQAEDSEDNNIDIKIVDEDSEEITTDRPDSASELEVTSTGDDPYSDAADTEGLETRTTEIPLTSSEVDYVNDNGEMYYVTENMNLDNNATLLIYESTIESTDEYVVPDDDIEDGTQPVERPGTFTVSLDVDGDQNSEYGTYDVEPGEDLPTTAILENTGDTTVEGTFVVTDEYNIPEGQYPEGQEIDGNYSTITSEISEHSVTIAGGETETIPVNLQWDEDEFGEHTIRFQELDSDGNPRDISGDEDRTPEFDAYVFQPSTLEIQNISVPENHMIYDNFNAEVNVTNIGDISGNVTINAEFGDWEGQKETTIGEGDARDNVSSDESTVRFARDMHSDNDEDVNFVRREYTTPLDVVSSIHDHDGTFELEPLSYESEEDDYFRPNSPFGMEEGEETFRVTIESDYDGSNPYPEVDDAMQHEVEETVELYSLIINDFNVNTNPENSDGGLSQRPTEDEATVYASAFPYVHPSLGLINDDVEGETFVDNYPVRGGYGTMYSSNTEDNSEAINRGATPLNHPDVGSVTQPENRYFSIYYSHQNRICNSNLLGDEDRVHVPEDEADESDTSVFLPFSADEELLCEDEDRFVSLQLPRFAGTTDAGVTETQDVDHPQGQLEFEGTNTETFEDVEEDDTIMYAVVSVSNPNEGQPATARFEIQSDRDVTARGTTVGIGPDGEHQIDFGDESFDSNVLGSAAVELQPEETQEVRVPIVLKNDEGNDGTHVLSVHPRDEDDYLRRTEDAKTPNEMEQSPITGDYHSQFEVPINVETYGDAIVGDLSPVDEREATSEDPDLAQQADLVVNSVCAANPDDALEERGSIPWNIINDYDTISPDMEEGLNPLSGHQDNEWGVSRSVGECNEDTDTDETVATFRSNYTNYGGETVNIRSEAIAEFHTQEEMHQLHQLSGFATGDRFFADYESGGDADIVTEAAYRTSEHGEIGIGEEVSVEPGETIEFEFERQFQEPGLYHVRTSPCRVLSEDSPKHYQLDGFTGIPDEIDEPGDMGPRLTLETGIVRNSETGVSDLTTSEISNSKYHGSQGCENAVTSVFVYDVTEPAPDFRIADSDTTIKQSDDSESTRTTGDQIPSGGIEVDEAHDVDEAFEVYEGGLLFFDGSTEECLNCYESGVPEYQGVSDISLPNSRTDDITSENLKSHRMTESNTIISDMMWSIDSEEPNFGDVDVCENVDDSDVDEHCYMESYNGNVSGEVIGHRFTESGTSTISLQAWDDERFTEGDSNTATVEQDIEVIEDNNPPDVSLDYTSHNDLSYGPSGSDTIWHRNEEIIDYDDLSDIDSNYDNTYEGIRTCLEADASDENIGISQDAWSSLGNNALVTDDGSFYEGGLINDFNANETRDGDRRCTVFESGGTQTIGYEAWDFADNSGTEEVDIEVESDDSAPVIDSFSTSYSGSSIWAANSNTNYRGGSVTFEAEASDSGIGIACMDLRANPTDSSCDSRDDGSSGSFSITERADDLGYTSGGTETETVKVTDWHGNTESDTASVDVEWDSNSPSISDSHRNLEGDFYGNNSSPPSSESTTVCSSFSADGTSVYDVSHSGSGSLESYDTGQSGEVCVEFEWDINTNPQPDPDPDAGFDDCDCSEPDYPDDGQEIEVEECDDDEDDDSSSGSATITIEDYHENTDSATLSYDYSVDDFEEECSTDTYQCACIIPGS